MQIKSVRVWTCCCVNFTQYEANARPENPERARKILSAIVQPLHDERKITA